MIPDAYRDLLERPLFAHLATVRPNGAPQSNPVWFVWDGTHIKMTNLKSRQKFRNTNREPRVSLSILDPENPYRYLEVRGVIERVEDDPDWAFYDSLAERYSRQPHSGPNRLPGQERIIQFMRPTRTFPRA